MDELPVKIFIRGANEWLESKDYPVPGTKWIPFNLHENRSLCEIEPWPEAESASYDTGSDNQGNLKYYSAPLVENTEVVGPVVLNLYASCRGTEMVMRASLWDVDPEGKETILNHGWLRASHRELDAQKSKTLATCPFTYQSSAFSPWANIPTYFRYFGPIANLFTVGHRIMLKISSTGDPPENLTRLAKHS